jgi:hypothetical protein
MRARDGSRVVPVLPERAYEEEDEATGRASVLAEPARSECARSMRAVESLPVACQKKRDD